MKSYGFGKSRNCHEQSICKLRKTNYEELSLDPSHLTKDFIKENHQMAKRSRSCYINSAKQPTIFGLTTLMTLYDQT
ncbi:hypothetical protein H6F44_11015 [Pseudanabaena sp. FACHB-1277]|uniref:Uncharacterized protein n=1 Tax=Pseudanabaena cinerea FACHB-1277 TaxID=2949581 RepID=A0A926USV5_9CYAN|nr:hypothetical protein [Pseudanabaena cinerea]MBD2150645.1 hypothetical protein [Pseudanabaena cinerea FACHB-1277]